MGPRNQDEEIAPDEDEDDVFVTTSRSTSRSPQPVLAGTGL